MISVRRIRLKRLPCSERPASILIYSRHLQSLDFSTHLSDYFVGEEGGMGEGDNIYLSAMVKKRAQL